MALCMFTPRCVIWFISRIVAAVVHSPVHVLNDRSNGRWGSIWGLTQMHLRIVYLPCLCVLLQSHMLAGDRWPPHGHTCWAWPCVWRSTYKSLYENMDEIFRGKWGDQGTSLLPFIVQMNKITLMVKCKVWFKTKTGPFFSF